MKKTILSLLIITSSIVLTSCNEQHMQEMEHYIKQVFLVGSGEEGGLLTRNVSFAKKEEELTTAVCISGSLTPEQDVHVTLEEAPSGIDIYNQKYKSENDVKYQVLPADNYEIPSFDVVIKAGETRTIVPVKVKPKGLHCDSLYAIPLKIKSCTEYPVLDPEAVVLVGVSTYNQYSGNYNYDGEKDGTSFSLLRNAVAVDANTIRIYNSGNEVLSSVKDEGLKIHINADNTLTLEGWDKMNVTSGTGTYDPKTKTFSFEFQYTDANEAEHSVTGTLVSASSNSDDEEEE